MPLALSVAPRDLGIAIPQELPWMFMDDMTSTTSHFMGPMISFVSSFTLPEETFATKKRFSDLVEKWHSERGIRSSLTEIYLCQSYLNIIAMGGKAVPLILQQLRLEGDDPDLWFVALEILTGENPVPTDDVGDNVKMAKAWLAWADQRYVG